MGRLRSGSILPLLLVLLARNSAADSGVENGSTTSNTKSEAAGSDPDDKSNLRGLSWFGFMGGADESEDSSDNHKKETPLEAHSPGSVKLIESVPCEPDHAKAAKFVALFGKVDSGNEACAAEADPDSCAGGCCRFGTYFLCDRTNSYIELPCVCNRNTAANHPHQGHIHSEQTDEVAEMKEEEDNNSSATSTEASTNQDTTTKNTLLDGTNDKKEDEKRDDATTDNGTEKKEDNGKRDDTAAIAKIVNATKSSRDGEETLDPDEDEKDGMLDSITIFLEGKKSESDDSQSEKPPLQEINEASFLTGWGGEPPDDQVDPGATKHGITSSTSSTTSSSTGTARDGEGTGDNTAVTETTGATNEAVYLTGWGGDPPSDQTDQNASSSDNQGSNGGEDHASNRDLSMDDYDYNHGSINEAVFLTPFGEGPSY